MLDCSSPVKYTREDNNNPVFPSDGDRDEDDIDIKNAKAKLKQLLKKQAMKDVLLLTYLGP